MKQDDELYVRTLIFGESNFSKFINANILYSTTEYILITKGFDSPLLQNFFQYIILLLKVIFKIHH